MTDLQSADPDELYCKECGALKLNQPDDDIVDWGDRRISNGGKLHGIAGAIERILLFGMRDD